jgi:uncharacterized membrane protein YjgN (DUF898 family)
MISSCAVRLSKNSVGYIFFHLLTMVLSRSPWVFILVVLPIVLLDVYLILMRLHRMLNINLIGAEPRQKQKQWTEYCVMLYIPITTYYLNFTVTIPKLGALIIAPSPTSSWRPTQLTHEGS